jgi:hypothetical protein
VASCVEASAEGWSGPVRTLVADHEAADGAFDVFVGADVEVTRLIENGAAVEGSERALPGIPWILSGATDLSALEAADAGGELLVLGGAAGYDARRQLPARLRERARQSLDAELLRTARLRVVPASLRGRRGGSELPWPPLRVSAVVLTGADDAQGAAKLIGFLASEGRAAFATCAGVREP